MKNYAVKSQYSLLGFPFPEPWNMKSTVGPGLPVLGTPASENQGPEIQPGSQFLWARISAGSHS
jgi:hypothetical protein